MQIIQLSLPLIGKTCTKCGKWKALSDYYRKGPRLEAQCKECKSERARRYHQNNLARRRAENLGYYYRNREQIARQRRTKYAEHREAILAYFRKLRLTRLDKEKTRAARYYTVHRDALLAKNRAYALAHPEQQRARWTRRRARERGANGSFTTQEWLQLKQCYDCHCLCCGKQEPEIKLVCDHVIPLCKGGTNDIGNIQPLCQPCNRRKGSCSTDYRTLAPLPPL